MLPVIQRYLLSLLTIVDLEVDAATSLVDYYGNGVQSRNGLNLASREFNIKVDYAIANSVCAVQSMKSWVVLDPVGVGASSMSSGEGDEVDDIEEFVEWHPNLDGGLVIEEDWTVIGPVPDGGGEYIE